MNKQNANDEDFNILPHLKALWKPLAVCTFFASLPLLSGSYFGPLLNPDQAGVFGDFVGGYIGTIVFTLSVWILFVSYQNQKATNQQTLVDQQKAHADTTFESRFFELLKYHRENVSEIEVGDLKSRRAFVSFIREWRIILLVVRAACAEVGSNLSVDQKAKLSFMAFFYGVGEELTPMLKEAASEENYPADLLNKLIPMLEMDKGVYRKIRDEAPNSDHVDYRMSSGVLKGRNIRFRAYIPFDGHLSHLNHYFRHLGHILKYAAAKAPAGTVQDHADLVRAQMTTHEQALLALYAVSIDGAWRTQNYVSEYDMTKNVPPKFFADDEFDG